jgi:DHA2 family multidrug resistance protein
MLMKGAFVKEAGIPINRANTRSVQYHWLVAAVAIPSLLMVILDTTVVDVIIPHMMAALNADFYDIQWVVISYMVAAAVSMPMFKRLAERLGYKNVILLGLALFTSMSALCGQARTMEMMIMSRIMQGVGEGLVIPAVTSLVFASFPPHQRGLAMGLIGLGATMGPALGPTLGGYMTQHFSWRWAFYINLPIGITLWYAAFLILKAEEGKTEEKAPPDMVGFILSTTFISSILVALSKGQEKGWLASDFILILFAIAAVVFPLFIYWEVRQEHPFIDLTIFRVKDFSVTMLIRLVFGGAIYGSFYLIPIYLEKFRMYPTFLTGLLMLPGALINGLVGIMVGRLTDRFGGKRLMALALVGMAVGFHLLSKADAYTSKTTLIMLIAFYIGFIGAVFTPLNYLSLACLSQKHLDTGASMIHVIRFIAGAMGTAFATSHMEFKRHLHFLGMTQKLDLSNPLLPQSFSKFQAHMKGQGQPPSWIQTQFKAFLHHTLTLKGYIFAFQDCMALFGLACLISLILIPILKGERQIQL